MKSNLYEKELNENMEKFKKWFGNFWYYNKWKTLLSIFLAIVVIVSVGEVLSKKKYDYTVYLYLSVGVTSNTTDALEECLEKYADDRDGNGNTAVQIINMSYDAAKGTNDQLAISASSTLMGELQQNKNCLFIVDDYRFDELNEKGVFCEKDYFPVMDGAAFEISGTPFYDEVKSLSESKADNFSDSLPEKLFFAMRYPPDEAKKTYDKYLDTEDWLKKIIEDNSGR